LNDRKDIQPVKNPISLISRGSHLKSFFPELEEADLREKWLTYVHLEKWPLSGISIIVV